MATPDPTTGSSVSTPGLDQTLTATGTSGDAPRILRLGDALADQIAAGEVVERPASVVKELLENAIDAGARRVHVELQGGGVESIVVVDDGHGIHPEDLALAVTRHATSKLTQPEDLVEIATLGFRGEALASMAAVAQLTVASRRRGATQGLALACRPGLAPEQHPVGMPVGTRVELLRLFANVPARRKFLRAEATEVGHVTQTVLRVALVQPQVHVSLRHGTRQLLELPAGSAAARVEQVLARGQRTALRRVQGEHDGIGVEAWLAPPEAALRHRTGLYIVVRQRVVREPNIARIVAGCYGEALATGRHPVACVVVDPPRGEVDVNVHPQKAEVRFGEPQRIYAAVREVLGVAGAPDADGALERDMQPPVPTADREGLGAALDSWAQGATSSVAREPAPAYRLRTRAADSGYARQRDSLRSEAQVLHQAWRDDRAADPQAPTAPTSAPVDPGPEYLGCLPGPVGLFTIEGELLAVDLRALRSHLVLMRLRKDLGDGEIAAQGLLEPVVVKLPADDVRQCERGRQALSRLGVHLEVFGDDAVIVRAVPASLRHCVGAPDVADLLARMLPWLRLRDDSTPDSAALAEAMAVMSQTDAPDPAPRLARRWLRDLVEEGARLDQIPGLQRWSPSALTHGPRHSGA
ncbi:MAG: DNA mismatch repair endonuclease MutL [Deltaproteobacteria bacterium]|nr:DNA mismatch repair endonuclease MutL [Deltaproteobacteria bacterium]